MYFVQLPVTCSGQPTLKSNEYGRDLSRGYISKVAGTCIRAVVPRVLLFQDGGGEIRPGQFGRRDAQPAGDGRQAQAALDRRALREAMQEPGKKRIPGAVGVAPRIVAQRGRLDPAAGGREGRRSGRPCVQTTSCLPAAMSRRMNARYSARASELRKT